jgi:hypothetical protein
MLGICKKLLFFHQKSSQCECKVDTTDCDQG